MDILNLLEMVRGFNVMKQVLFNQDDRFLLDLQRRDMIYKSSTDEKENLFESKRFRSGFDENFR